MKKKTILIDIDDVVCSSVYYETLKQIVGSDKKIEDCNFYHAEENLNATPEQLEKYWRSVTTKSPYSKAIVNQECVNTIKKLTEKYDVYFCSSCVLELKPDKSANIFKFKFEFLLKTFPFIHPYNFIFIRNKKLLKADIMLDDRPSNFGQNIKKKLLYTAYHNKNMSEKELKKLELKRVNDWNEVANILL